LMRTTSTAPEAWVPLAATVGGAGVALLSPMARASSPIEIEASVGMSMCCGILPGPNRSWVLRMICGAPPGGVMVMSGVVGVGLPAGA
jgi:hypothetical protein